MRVTNVAVNKHGLLFSWLCTLVEHLDNVRLQAERAGVGLN